MLDVEVSHLTKRFAETAAVNDVSLRVENEIVALLGPSGCGKTTLLRCIAGLETPDKGEISIKGNVVTKPEEGIFVPTQKRKLGMVFQSYALWPHLTVFENVVYGLKEIKALGKEKMRAKVKGALELVEMEGLEERYPWQLSGGQQQRVALSRSIVYEPEVLLLDEPLSNLDLRVREKTRGELKDLLKRIGISSIYVTHDQEEAFVISDRIIVMNQGNIVQEGTPEEIYFRPANKFAASFIGKTNILRGVVDTCPTGGMGTVKIHEFMDQRLECKIPPDLKVGDSCGIVIRSNEVNIFDEKPGDEVNVCEGHILRKEFKGSVIDYYVKTFDSTIIVSTHRLCPHASVSEESSNVAVVIPPEAISVIAM